MDGELNSENSSGLGETHGQSEVCESSVARPQGSEAAPAAATNAASAEGSHAAGARDEGQAKAGIAQPARPSVEAESNAPAGKTGSSSVAAASFAGAAVDPLKEASAALEDRDFATAQRLFAAIGRNDVAEKIKDALAALDRKDYAKAHGLFEALGQKGAAAAQAKESTPATPPTPATSAVGPIASDSRIEARQKPAASPLDVVPPVDAAYRRPLPQAEKAKPRRRKPRLLGTGLAIIAIFGVSAIYGSPLSWTFPTKSEAVAGLSSAADVLKADLEAITGQSAREKERSATHDLSAALTQLTARLDQMEQAYGARLDKLSERVDQDSSSKFADISARLDKLEKKAASPATPASQSAEVVARLDKLERRVAAAATSASEIAGLTTRLSKLERRAAAGAISASPLPPAGPRQSSAMARAEPSAPNETGRSDDPGPLLRNYSVENVRDGVAIIDTRDGPQEVAPGDSVPGAGRVLRIERRGGDWFVVTSRGVIGSGPAP